MTEEQNIKRIVEILRGYEEALSDGYGYYCAVNETLERIAKDILEAVRGTGTVRDDHV